MSGIRCETPGCRGNAPCPACLAGLSVAIERGLRKAFPIARDEHSQLLIRSVLRDVKEDLDRYWAKIIGKTPERARLDVGRTAQPKTRIVAHVPENKVDAWGYRSSSDAVRLELKDNDQSKGTKKPKARTLTVSKKRCPICKGKNPCPTHGHFAGEGCPPRKKRKGPEPK